MKTDILLVSDQQVFDRITEVNENVSPKQLKYNVLAAQDMYLRPILGDKLYFKLLEDFEFSTGLTSPFIPLTPKMESLLEMARQVVITRTVQRVLLPLTAQITNKGPQVGSADYSQPAGESLLWRLFNHYKRDSEFYERRLQNFLTENKADYPEWQEKSADMNAQKPTQEGPIIL